MRREWIEIGEQPQFVSQRHQSLPPCGGSGLKYHGSAKNNLGIRSPSMRREWIEIPERKGKKRLRGVSLHAEGVD